MSTAERTDVDRSRSGFKGGVAGTRWRFDVEAYHRMVEAGIFGEDDRVELLDGDVVIMSPIGSPHASVTSWLNRLLSASVADRALVGARHPIRLDDRSEPQPDLAVFHLRDDRYKSRHPTPADTYFLVEVVDSSAGYDRGAKLRAYARAGVPEVWLVDLNGELVETHRRPVGEAYTITGTHPRGDRVASEAFPDASLEVDEILG